MYVFLTVKMNANYAEICRVGKFRDRFSTSSVCSIFLKCSQYCCKASKIQIQQKKVKNVFVDKKSLYYRNCIGQTKFWS